MKALNYWSEFMSTGKIDDYLTYKNRDGEGPEIGECPKEVKDAGVFECDRHDSQGASDWRI